MLYTYLMKRYSAGFTIVEILIIIVVIGILATITVLSFNGVQQQAREAGIKSDFEASAARIERYRSEKGEYPPVPSSSDANLLAANIEIQKSLFSTEVNNYLYCVSSDGQSFAFAGQSLSRLTYAYGTAREFGRYTSQALANYVEMCNALTGMGSGYRYGYVTNGGWRTWSQ